MFLKQLCAPLLLAAILATSASARNTEFNDQELASYVSLEELSTQGGTTTLRFRLETDEYDRISARMSHRAWLTGPKDGRPEMELTSARWVAVERLTGKVIGPYSLEEKDTPVGGLPPLLKSPDTRFVDYLRLAPMHRLEVPVGAFMRGSEGESYTAVMLESTFTVTWPVQGGDFNPERQQQFLRTDPYLEQLLEGQLANPGQLALGLREPEPIPGEARLREWNGMLAAAEQRGPLLQGRLPRGGLYHIDRQAIADAGIDPETISPRNLQVFLGAREIPVVAENADRNRFAPNTRLMFFVPHFETEQKPWEPLWLMTAPPGQAPLRAQARVPNRDVAEAEMSPAKATTKVTIFEPNEFNHLLAMDGPQLRWATAVLNKPGYQELPFTTGEVRRDDPVQVTAYFSGAQPTNELDLRFYINGERVHQAQLRGRRTQTATFAFPSALLREGENQFAVEMPEQESRGGVIFLAADLAIPTTTAQLLPNQPADLEMPEGQGEGARPMLLAFDPPDDDLRELLAADITDPLNPIVYRLTGSHLQNGCMQMVVPAEAPTPRRVTFSQPDMLLPVRLSQVSAPESFLGTEQADYIAIYHPSLLPALEPLLQARSRTRTVRGFSIDDIYNAFSYGESSYHALAQFLAHGFKTRQGPRVSEVLLVGEGSEYWWELRKASDHVTPNMVPVYGWANPRENIRGDDAYSLVAGDGALSDLEIGRLSVENPGELKIAVEKLLAYEEDPPLGDWLTRHLFVTDDEPEFERVAREVIEKSFAGDNYAKLLGLQYFPYEDYFRGIWRKRSAEITDRLLEEWDRGAATITYLGHGGPNLWSGERILHIRDVDRLKSEGRDPFLIAGSCDTGWVDYPVEPVRTSLAEHLLRAEGGGAIGAFIPISGTSSYEHNFLLTELYRALMRDGVTDVGQATLLSKINYMLYRTNQSVTRQYLLMGDPALQMVRPEEPLPVSIRPGQLTSVTPGELHVEGTVPDLRWGMAEALLLSEDKEPVARQRLRVAEGRFSGKLVIPRYLEPGDYEILVTAEDGAKERVATAYAEIPVRPAEISVAWTMDPPTTGTLPAGTPVTVTYTVKNNMEVPLVEGVLRITDAENEGQLAEQPLSLQAGGELSRSTKLPLPVGVNSFRAEVLMANAPDADPVPLASDALVIKGQPAKGDVPLMVGFSRTELELQELPGDQGHRLFMPLYDMTGGALPAVQAGMRWQAADGDRLGDLVPLDVLRQTGRQEITFPVRKELHGERAQFFLEVRANTEESTRTLQLYPFTLNASRGYDLEVVPGSLVLENEYPVSGKTVFLRYKIRNVGLQPARDVEAQLYVDRVWEPDAVAADAVGWVNRTRFEEVRPGEELLVRQRWDNQGTAGGKHTLWATVVSVGPVLENKLENNKQSISVNLLPSPNLLVDHEGVQLSQNVVEPYDRVWVTVPVLNNSDYDFLREFHVAITAESYTGESRRLLRQGFEELRAGESSTLQFEWLVRPGEYKLGINVNDDREYMEETYDDNEYFTELMYVFPVESLAVERGQWNFDTFPEFGHSQGIQRLPGPRLTTENAPRVNAASFRPSPEYLVEGELARGLLDDGLFGTIGNGGMVMAYGEEPAPVTFRFPIPDDVPTDYMEFLLWHLGASNPETNSGHLKYRINGAKEWSDLPRNQRGSVHSLGRFRIRNGAVVMEFAPSIVPSLNHVGEITLAPVMGVYESPILSVVDWPKGKVEVSERLEGDSRIEYQVRYASGTTSALQWANWQGLEPGNPLPPRPQNARFIQWRAQLIEAPDGKPSLMGLRIGMDPAGDQVAAGE